MITTVAICLSLKKDLLTKPRAILTYSIETISSISTMPEVYDEPKLILLIFIIIISNFGEISNVI